MAHGGEKEATMTGKKERKDSPAGRGAVRILHLSDFHFSAERRWDSDPVVRALTQAIGKLVSDGLVPDVVAITCNRDASNKAPLPLVRNRRVR